MSLFFPFSRSVSLKTKFYSILSALTSHLKGLPLKWFRNSWFLASVRFSIQRPFAPSVPVPSRPQRRDWLRGLRYSLAFWLRHTGVLSSFFCPPGTSASPRGSTSLLTHYYQENNTTAWHFVNFLVSFYCVTVQPSSMAEDHSQTETASRLLT